jgi:glycosyltransferase involved in cell wall biosynthesis
MRILMVAQFYPPTVGGEERVVHDLSVELAARDHRVAVATLCHDGLPEHEELDGVRIHRIKTSLGRIGRVYSDPSRRHAPPFPDPEAVAGLRRVIHEEQPDIVHAHNWLGYSYVPLKRKDGPRFVVSLHDYSLVCTNKRLMRQGRRCSGPGFQHCVRCSQNQYGRFAGPALTLSNAAASSATRLAADLFLPVSRFVAEAAQLASGSTPYRVIPNFTREVAPATCGTDISELPDRFIMFAGDMEADKGVPVLLEAYRGVPDAPPLVLIGRAARSDLARELGDHVRFFGPKPHSFVLEAWRRCLFGVVPSVVPEAFGLAGLEAMAAGRAVVATTAGALSDVVGDGGILVPAGSVSELRTALERLTHDEALRNRLSAAARRRASTFTAAKVVPQFEAAYRDLLGATAPAR